VSWVEDRVMANALQWDGREPGHFEAYTLNVVDPSNRAGWWLRHAVDAPMDGEEHASLWGAHFQEDDPPKRFALKTQFPARAFGTQSDGFHIRVSKAELSSGGAQGGLRSPEDDERALRWNMKSAHHAPAAKLYDKRKRYEDRHPEHKILVPGPLATTGGVVEASGDRFELENARAHQLHSWGRSRFDRWTYGHATFFRERPEAYVSVFLGENEDGGKLGGAHYHDADGLSLAFDDVRTVTDDGPGREPGVWTFEAKTRGWRLSGRFSASLQRMLGVRYEDPDGSVRYCHHGGVADATLELWKTSWGRRKLHQTLTSRGASVFEQGDRRPYGDVEFYI
jgi:hypothetical protein